MPNDSYVSILETKAADLSVLLPSSLLWFISSKSHSRVYRPLEDLWLCLDLSKSAKRHVVSSSLNWRFGYQSIWGVFPPREDSRQDVIDMLGFFTAQSIVGVSTGRGGVTLRAVTHMRRDLWLCQNWRISSVWQLAEWSITPPNPPLNQWNKRMKWKSSKIIKYHSFNWSDTWNFAYNLDMVGNWVRGTVWYSSHSDLTFDSTVMAASVLARAFW